MNGTDSSFHLWVDPGSLGGGDPGLGTANASLTGLDVADIGFGTLGMYAGATAGQASLDEFRFGETFADVTPSAIPEPATVGMLGLGALVVMLLRRKR